MLEILVRYYPAFLGGAFVTLQLALIVWSVGLVGGIIVGVWRSTLKGIAKTIDSIFGMVIASIPVLVLLLWFHYPLQSQFNIAVNPFVTSAFVLSFYNALIISDQVRGAIGDFPRAYRSAAAVTGVSERDFMIHVMLPISFRTLLPGYLVSQVAALHLTLFASLISVNELFRVAQRINSIEYSAVEVFSLIALFYLVLSMPLLLLAKWAKSKFTLSGLDQ